MLGIKQEWMTIQADVVFPTCGKSLSHVWERSKARGSLSLKACVVAGKRQLPSPEPLVRLEEVIKKE